MTEERRPIEIQPDLTISSLWSRQKAPEVAVILAHGAGAGMDHEFMAYFHGSLESSGIPTVRFNFPYVERGRKAPDRPPLLEKTFRKVIEAVRAEWAPAKLFIGGKSMGGRIASHLASQGETLSGLFLLGYPLHPPGRPERLRREHLASIRCPCLFIQGSRDNLCRLDLLEPELERMAAPVELFVVEGGNHSFQTPKRFVKSRAEVREEIAQQLIYWIEQQT